MRDLSQIASVNDNCEKGRISVTEDLLHFIGQRLVASEKALEFESKAISV
jgi:hypothetical protein